MMRRLMSFLGVILLLSALIKITPAYAQPEEGVTTQGEFAIWLIKQAGALSHLSPAAQGQEAIDFLISLGMVPAEGWDEDKPIDKDFLRSLLGLEEGEELSFEDLLAKLLDKFSNLLSDRNLGVFRATSSASSSAPAA